MWQDPIVKEVRQVREAHAEQFNFDLNMIYKALKEQEIQSQRKKVSFPPKRIPSVNDKEHVLAA
ncbi:MAG: hypothetical protein JXA89_20160 [Anaerolineae bacterium]|nr:hypothetical protein [Anaerolineae bacterium]